MRTIHYGIRLASVLILVSLFYGSVAFLFHETIQLPVLITLLFIALVTERLWVLLEWIGPVAGTVNRGKQERDQKLMVEYLLACSLRYQSPLVIAALRTRKRLSLHVVSHLLRMPDTVLRRSADSLLILLPYTGLDQAPAAFARLARRIPIKDIVMTDVNMLRALMEARNPGENVEIKNASPRELRKLCFRAFEEKFASINASEDPTSAPVIYNLFVPDALDAPETLHALLEAAGYGEEAVDAVVPATKDESAQFAR